jgi:hypothetical protein
MNDMGIRHFDRVIVTHDLGNEPATVIGIAREVVPGEGTRVTVQFDDGTISTWPATQITI